MKGARRQATILLSGGVDSAACAHLLQAQRFTVGAVYIDYGQSAVNQESKAASSLANHFGIELHRLQLAGAGEFESGEVVGRNAFLILSTLLLTRGKAPVIAVGLHSGTPYYDSSESFVASLSKLLSEHTDGRVTLLAPFATWTKRDVYAYFVATEIPLTLTYSCEVGVMPVCGRCRSCKDRKILEC